MQLRVGGEFVFRPPPPTTGPPRLLFIAGGVAIREKQIGGSGGSLEPPGPLLTHLHTVYIAYYECLPTRLNPLAERTCFSQVGGNVNLAGFNIHGAIRRGRQSH